MLHEKCVEEKKYEDGPSHLASPAPLRHLIHGLPGSGKSELTRWIQNYFEEVWQYKKGQQFVFLAPMNSMANNIGGSTVHSWGQIGFKDMLRSTTPCSRYPGTLKPSPRRTNMQDRTIGNPIVNVNGNDKSLRRDVFLELNLLRHREVWRRCSVLLSFRILC